MEIMSKIGTTEVERIAKLARIGLSADEVSKMSAELGQILQFVEQLQSVDIEGVVATDQVNGLVDVTREDVVRPSMDRDLLLANAPASRDGYVVVKRVLN
jgi:aspartyl-tRNA(Asn)/glutamyl-tRNA(Gln) amidotransferase subunit C